MGRGDSIQEEKARLKVENYYLMNSDSYGSLKVPWLKTSTLVWVCTCPVDNSIRGRNAVGLYSFTEGHY